MQIFVFFFSSLRYRLILTDNMKTFQGQVIEFSIFRLPLESTCTGNRKHEGKQMDNKMEQYLNLRSVAMAWVKVLLRYLCPLDFFCLFNFSSNVLDNRRLFFINDEICSRIRYVCQRFAYRIFFSVNIDVDLMRNIFFHSAISILCTVELLFSLQIQPTLEFRT